MTKEELRIWAKNERSKLDMEGLSSLFVAKVRETDEYKTAKHIMLYYPIKDEINLLPLMEDEDKTFYLPKIHDKELLCCPYKKSDKLAESNFKTMEPLTETVDKGILDLIIVPALVCDMNNYRLGYGKGFYDRFLAGIRAKTISCVPKGLLVKTIEPEACDIPVTKVITE